MVRRHWLLAGPSFAAMVGCASIDSNSAPQAQAQSPDSLAIRRLEIDPPIAAVPSAPVAAAAPIKVLSVTLDAVLQLAECQNQSLAIAREKVNQAYAEHELAAKSWLPDVSVGTGYYRHEGGIQLQEGPLIKSSTGAAIAGMDAAIKIDPRSVAFAKIDAARRVKQSQGEYKKLSTDVLLDAAGTYIDLLAAQSGLALAAAWKAI